MKDVNQIKRFFDKNKNEEMVYMTMNSWMEKYRRVKVLNTYDSYVVVEIQTPNPNNRYRESISYYSIIEGDCQVELVPSKLAAV